MERVSAKGLGRDRCRYQSHTLWYLWLRLAYSEIRMGGSILHDILSSHRHGSTDSSLLRAPRNTRVLSVTRLLASQFELALRPRAVSRLATLSVSVLRAMPVLVVTALALLATQACPNTAKAVSSHTTPDIATRTSHTEVTLYITVLLHTLSSRSPRAWSPSMLPP